MVRNTRTSSSGSNESESSSHSNTSSLGGVGGGTTSGSGISTNVTMNNTSTSNTSTGSIGGSISNHHNKVLPADHIMFKLLGDFKEHTKVKIEIFIRDDKIRLEDFFEGPESKTFHQVLEGLTEVSKYFLNLITSALLNWRSTQHLIPSKSSSKPKMDDSVTKKDVTPIVDERYKLIVDYIFCTTISCILNSLTKDNLTDAMGIQIESMCFESFKVEKRISTNSSPMIIPDLCASILGQLSKYRLRSVSSRFFKEFQLCLTSNALKNKTFQILQGIRFLKVKISSVSKLKQSQEFINNYLEFFKNNRIKGDLRRAISEILASILRPLTEEKFKPELSYTEWISTIKELYEFINKKTKKTKDVLTSFPLLSILLCCLDKESFLKQFWQLMDNFIKCKDKTIRPYALEASQYLLECYLTKYSEQPEEVYERLHQLVSHIFPNGHSKKLTMSASDPLDVFVDIICVIAGSRIDFAFEKIIFDLLRGGEQKDLYISNPERMIVGLRAVMMIDQQGTNPLTPKMLSFSNSPNQSPSASPLPDPLVSGSHKARAVRRQRYGTLNTKKVAPTSLIEPYLKNLSILLSQILLSLDSTFGFLLTSNQTKPLGELLEKMRPPGYSCLELLKIAVSVIPIAFPNKIVPQDLVVMLSKFLIHMDRGVSEKASIVLTQLMAARPDIRPQIIYGLGRFALYLSDKQSNLIAVVLEKKRELLDLWARFKTNKFSLAANEEFEELRFRADHGENIPDISYVEAVALTFLCSSNGRNRKLCLHILDSIRSVHESFLMAKEDDDIEISTYLKDIIDENGCEYLYRHAQNYYFSNIGQINSNGSNSNNGSVVNTSTVNVGGVVIDVVNKNVSNTIGAITSASSSQQQPENKYKRQKSPQDFERMAESESKEDQILWSCCLADIIKAGCELCPKTIGKSTDLVLQRIKPIQPDESQKAQSVTPEQEQLWIWWRNYIILACATIQVTDNTFLDIKKKQTTNDSQDHQYPVSARELFNLIVPYLKSMDRFFAESSLAALEKTNSYVLEVLFDVLKPLENELHGLRKTKKKTDVIKSVIGIRRHCLESLKPGELVKRDMLKKSYVDFIQEILQFLNVNVPSGPDPSNEYLWDNLHYIRFNFCAMVHRIVQQLYSGGHEFLEKTLRRDLFKAFNKWSESEELIREESTSRKLVAFLQQEEKEAAKRKEAEIRIYEHASQLSHVASHALSVILLGPFFIETFKDPNGVIFQWINQMFLSGIKTKLRAITRTGLQNFLKHNLSHQELIYHCINQCYSSQIPVAHGYFISLVELCQDEILKFDFSESIMMNLIIFNCGTKSSNVRQHSLQLLALIRASRFENSENQLYGDCYYPSTIGSEIPETFLNAQYHLSEKLSLENEDLCYEFFMDVVYRLETISQDHQRQMLNYVKPWIKQMSLLTLASENSHLLESVLQGLVLISIKYSVNHSHLIEELWRVLGRNQDNIGVIIDFLIGITEKTRNHELIPIFKRICIFLGRSSPQKLINCLVGELTSNGAPSIVDITDTQKISSGRLRTTIHQRSAPVSSSEVVYNTVQFISMSFQNSTEIFGDRQPKSSPLTRFQLPLIFLSEVSYEIGEEFRVHLPVLLQLVFLGLYYNSGQPVHDHCRMLLLNLIRSLVIKKFQMQEGGTIDNPLYEDAVQLVDFLMPSENSPKVELQSKKDISNPKYVVMLSKRIAFVLSPDGSTDLNEQWGVAALNWATNSQNQRLAMRSFQILRGLEPTTTIDSLTEVMQTLGKHIQNTSSENALFISEIQETLQVMIKCIHPTKLILFPQIFWGTLAMLHTDFENHFVGAIKLLSQLLDIINFSDRAVQNVFLASMPKDWENFHGVQPLVIKGLMSNNTTLISLEFLSKITLQPCDEIFHPEPIRFITNLISLLPFLCLSIGDNCILAQQASENISIVCENHGYDRLSTIFEKYSNKSYFKHLDSFLQDISGPLCENVIKHSTLVFSLLFNMLEFGSTDYRYPILKILTMLVKGGVNPAETKSSRVPEWFDTVTQFLNDHKTPHYIVSQAIRFIEITSGISPTSLTTIDNASLKPSKNTVGAKKFSNKVERGTLFAANYLHKVLDTCARSVSLTKSIYSTTQIFETFFSNANDDQANIQKHYENSDDNYSDNGDDGHSSSNGTIQQPSSELDMEMDTDTLRSNDFDGPEFHNFPHFQGFNDILEGLGDMSMDDSSNMSTSQLDSSTISTKSNNFGTFNKSSINNVEQFNNGIPLSPISTSSNSSNLVKENINLISNSSSGSSSNLLNFKEPSNVNNNATQQNITKEQLSSSTSSTNSINTNSVIAPTSPSSTTRSSSRSLHNSSSPTLSRNIIHSNQTLTTMSYNVTAAKSWWNSCSEQFEFNSEKDLLDAFTAASQLINQITIEYKTLFNQCLPLILSISTEVSALSVDIFEKPTFMNSYNEIQNTVQLAERYKKVIQEKPSISKVFLEHREKAISNFTNHLKIYTEQRTSTNNTRAKLFENGITNDESQVQITETRFCFAVCNLYQHLLQLWISYINMQQLLIDHCSVPQSTLQCDKQRDEIKKELNKCKVLAVLFKEKESDILSKILQQQLQQHTTSINNNSNNLGGSSTNSGGNSPLPQQNSSLSPIVNSIHSQQPISTSPTSLSSPSLLDESHRLTTVNERKRSSTSSRNYMN
ncbi:hypothetical protein DICPUDRAFT_152002 [Dictyostelium purpureum]|uniref:Uncharacterized protein n=1 Tax=Dictyostelium purpureum TaxID=5786 RepID=F0ZK90_DICPU|nr:uncharacterized protein DICPUDRAFT_152002 [Dictyostelium purpureum]EGC35659.1 hypothetical protein DICPUDRAFT_152002 [Dictyostelium purpureum]|eukprot:XP_003287838.1 hypothetical protein DICPUDRAFT_152002 [Dictyostelium purpureum]